MSSVRSTLEAMVAPALGTAEAADGSASRSHGSAGGVTAGSCCRTASGCRSPRLSELPATPLWRRRDIERLRDMLDLSSPRSSRTSSPGAATHTSQCSAPITLSPFSHSACSCVSWPFFDFSSAKISRGGRSSTRSGNPAWPWMAVRHPSFVLAGPLVRDTPPEQPGHVDDGVLELPFGHSPLRNAIDQGRDQQDGENDRHPCHASSTCWQGFVAPRIPAQTLPTGEQLEARWWGDGFDEIEKRLGLCGDVFSPRPVPPGRIEPLCGGTDAPAGEQDVFRGQAVSATQADARSASCTRREASTGGSPMSCDRRRHSFDVTVDRPQVEVRLLFGQVVDGQRGDVGDVHSRIRQWKAFAGSSSTVARRTLPRAGRRRSSGTSSGVPEWCRFGRCPVPERLSAVDLPGRIGDAVKFEPGRRDAEPGGVVVGLAFLVQRFAEQVGRSSTGLWLWCSAPMPARRSVGPRLGICFLVSGNQREMVVQRSDLGLGNSCAAFRGISLLRSQRRSSFNAFTRIWSAANISAVTARPAIRLRPAAVVRRAARGEPELLQPVAAILGTDANACFAAPRPSPRLTMFLACTLVALRAVGNHPAP